jgi:hypothetical protein
MAVQYVKGASPVTFISEDTATSNAGMQYQIPLPLITYDVTQTPAVVLTGWPQFAGLAASDQPLAQSIVQNLINHGALALSASPAP